MLSENSLKEFASKWQTTELNVAREYFQHLFLSNFYLLKESEHTTFKGGTALRILYNSPRFSEDLDFTSITKAYSIEKCIESTVENLQKEVVNVNLTESKATSGGWFAVVEVNIYQWPLRVELNISFRKKSSLTKESVMMVSSPIVPSYMITALDEKILVEEKITALLTRAKPRDFFDLYFILRARLAVEIIARYQTRIVQKLTIFRDSSFVNELKNFLPRSHWNIINKLPQTLKSEMNRF